MSKTEGQRRSIKQERRISKSFKELVDGARMVAGSGRKWNMKGDVSLPDYLIEAKTKATKQESITVKKLWIDKIEKEAYEVGKNPLLAISFGDSIDYFVMRDKHFLSLIAELEELRNFKAQAENPTE